eukprot:TRINITY_DN21118_c0_g1_i5.p1 TRINITY_DN21118_c0_g1~~TRINITY_DN21118_c0_g1_i5.p1  ORF type:complete len:282 (-),score=60.43 TRINITY_DN21118_c0_g1_i5:467-1312(-)
MASTTFSTTLKRLGTQDHKGWVFNKNFKRLESHINALGNAWNGPMYKRARVLWLKVRERMDREADRSTMAETLQKTTDTLHVVQDVRTLALGELPPSIVEEILEKHKDKPQAQQYKILKNAMQVSRDRAAANLRSVNAMGAKGFSSMMEKSTTKEASRVVLSGSQATAVVVVAPASSTTGVVGTVAEHVQPSQSPFQGNFVRVMSNSMAPPVVPSQAEPVSTPKRRRKANTVQPAVQPVESVQPAPKRRKKASVVQPPVVAELVQPVNSVPKRRKRRAAKA